LVVITRLYILPEATPFGRNTDAGVGYWDAVPMMVLLYDGSFAHLIIYAHAALYNAATFQEISATFASA
jgi:hypothetical protein